MTNAHRSTRLGDLLVEQGLITRSQLTHAISLQEIRRKHVIKLNAPNSYTQELGELLIELGFINRNQLKSSLGWQKRLRKTTAVMVFVAPLLTVACGGGGGSGGGSAGTNNTQPPASSASSSAPLSSSAFSSSSIPPSSSSFSLLSSSKSSAASSELVIAGPVQIYWRPPTQRENGDFLDITELGGYELRYKRKSDIAYSTIIIQDGYVDAYYFEYLHGEYEFQIAAFDVNGIYSAFVPVKPR